MAETCQPERIAFVERIFVSCDHSDRRSELPIGVFEQLKRALPEAYRAARILGVRRFATDEIVSLKLKSGRGIWIEVWGDVAPPVRKTERRP